MKLREMLRSGRAAAILALVTGYEVIFKHRFGLRTFFATGVTTAPPPVQLDLGYANVLQMKLILFGRYALRSQTLFPRWFHRVEQAMLTRLRRSRIDPASLVSPLPILQAGEIDPDRFYQEYVLQGRPVVIRGGVSASEAARTWDVGFFGRRYGDAEAQILDPARESEYRGPIREVLDSAGTDKRLYIYGATNLMRDHPELVEQLGVLDFRRHMTRRPIGYAGSQLFLGVHHRSGSGWHCATGNNLFFMIQGRKRWTFAHADYTWLMYPLVNQTCQTLISPLFMLLGRRHDAAYIREHFPLFEYCPRQEVTLEPGDVLFNPTWNWHNVENLSEESIAVSSRWLQPIKVSHNRFVELCMLFSGYLTRRRFTAIRQRGFSISDENVREIYKSMDHRVDFGRPGAFDRMRARYRVDSLEPT
jgi:hypothetical protein